MFQEAIRRWLHLNKFPAPWSWINWALVLTSYGSWPKLSEMNGTWVTATFYTLGVTANVPNSESWKHFLEICFQRLLRGKKIQLPLKMWASRCTNLPLHAPQNRFLSCNLKGDRLNTKINVFLRIFLFFFLRAHSTSRLPYYLTRLVEKALLQNKTWRFLVVQFTIGSSSSGGLSHVTGSKGTLCRCQKSATR